MTDVTALVDAVREKANEGEMGKKLASAIKEADKPSVKSPEEYIKEGYQEALGGSGSTTPTRGRGRPPGAKKKITKAAAAAEDPAAGLNTDRFMANMNKTGWTPTEVTAVANLRKKCGRWFQKFPHRLQNYFSGRPPIETMSIQELKDLDLTVKVCLDEADECEYVRRAFVWSAQVIENIGPDLYKRFLRWAPGSDVLCHQQGLGQAVEHLTTIPGEQGLADEVNRIGVEFTGYAPANPWFNGIMKIYSVMKAVENRQLVQESPSSTLDPGTSSESQPGPEIPRGL